MPFRTSSGPSISMRACFTAPLSTIAILAVALASTSAIAGDPGPITYINTVGYTLHGEALAGPKDSFDSSDLIQSFDTTPNHVSALEELTATSASANGTETALATSEIYAYADFGTLRVRYAGLVSRQSTASQATGGGASVNGNISARSQDVFVVHGGEPGRQVHLQASFNLNGGIQVAIIGDLTNQHQAGSNFRMELSGHLTGGNTVVSILPPAPAGGGVFALDVQNLNPNVTPVMYQADGIIPLDFFVTEGQPYALDYSMRLVGGASAGFMFTHSPGIVSLIYEDDFSHTLNWGGISSVTDAQTGLPVEGWSITSDSGVNYATALPEPEPTCLSIFAITAVLSMRTWRRRFPARRDAGQRVGRRSGHSGPIRGSMSIGSKRGY